jgi:serine/threonine-protein kinase
MLIRDLATRTLLAVLLLVVTSNARADEPLRIALFKTASEDTSLQSLAAAIDPVLLSELGNVPGLQIAARPALDLPSMQLAIDCVGETADCLTQAAKQAQAEGLVAPVVRKLGSELVVTILLHDARKQLSITGATRRYPSDQLDQALDGIPGMVRELFGLQAPAVAASAPPPEAAEPAPAAPPPPAASKPFPVLPVVLGAVGVAILGAGVGLGIASHSTGNAYVATPVTDETTGNDALDKLHTARTEATLANVAFGVGAAALAAGVVLFILQQHGSDDKADAAQAMQQLPLATRTGQLALSGHWD